MPPELLRKTPLSPASKSPLPLAEGPRHCIEMTSKFSISDMRQLDGSARQSDLNSYLKSEFLIALGLDQVAASPILNPISIDRYKAWIELDQLGSMQYLKTHLPLKENPKLIHDNLQSAICVTQNYLLPKVASTLGSLPVRTALYSQTDDYHIWLKQKLNVIIEKLSFVFPNEVFVPFVDSGPILERDLAYQLGLGWFGKNSCLIHPKHGSLFFIAEILTTLKISEPAEFEPLPDFCGTCTKCIDSCPTSAIRNDRTLNATDCISYITIESKGVPTPEIRSRIGDWFFGCDICQTVCPWNQKVFRSIPAQNQSEDFKTRISSSAMIETEVEKRTELVVFLKEMLTLSGKQLQKNFKGSPLLRAGPFGLRRNAMFVIANQNLFELSAEVQDFLKDEKLRAHT